MSQDPSSAPDKTGSPLKRALIIAGVVVFVAWGSKLYRDTKLAIDGPDPASVAEMLSGIHERAVAAEGFEPLLNDLGRQRSCASRPTKIESRASLGPWGDLVPEEIERLDYELLVREPDARHYLWIARRDRDCDGIYEIHALRAPRSSGGDRSGDVVVQNLAE